MNLMAGKLEAVLRLMEN